MKAKDLAEELMEHPENEVYCFGIKGSIESHNVIFNGFNWWIGQ